jgi:hypothetical protein
MKILRMARKDISDKQVIKACKVWQNNTDSPSPLVILMLETDQPEKVCWAAMERAVDRNLIEYGTTMKYSWPTPKGLELLDV